MQTYLCRPGQELCTAEVPVPTDGHAGDTQLRNYFIMRSGISRESWSGRYLNDASVTAGAQRGALDHSVTNADGSEVVLSPETDVCKIGGTGTHHTEDFAVFCCWCY